MNEGLLNDRKSAANLLSTYLSLLFRASILVPPEMPDVGKVTGNSIVNFLHDLPQIYQQAVDGPSLIFTLPLVASGKGTSLTPSIANVVNELLEEVVSTNTGSDQKIKIPTFFYGDGSTMVLVIVPVELGNAITIITQNKRVRNFLVDAITSLKA